MRLQTDTPNSIPVCRPVAEQLEHVAQGAGVRQAQALPSGRELAGFLDPNTITRPIEELKRSGYRPLYAQAGGPEVFGHPAGQAAAGHPAGEGAPGEVEDGSQKPDEGGQS